MLPMVIIMGAALESPQVNAGAEGAGQGDDVFGTSVIMVMKLFNLTVRFFISPKELSIPL
jgi:hypothetical protein